MDTAHRDALMKFLEPGKPRMVLAADLSLGGQIVRFPNDIPLDDTAERQKHRDHAKAHLTCVLDSCGAGLHAHFRPLSTDGYAHKSGFAQEHSPESKSHQMAKQFIADWANAVPGVTAEQEVSSCDRTRRPDVTITLGSGAQIAIEVQYSEMNIEDYHARSADHVKQYAARAWLLGHFGPNTPWSGARRTLNALAQAILANGDTLAWINPTDRTLLTVWDTGDKHGRVLPTGAHPQGHTIDSLDDCVLDERRGILTPTLRTIDHAHQERERARLQAEREAAAAAAERRRRAEAAAERRKRAWLGSEDHAWLHGLPPAARDGLPKVKLIDGVDPIAVKLDVVPEHWRTRVYRTIDMASDWVTWQEICSVLVKVRPSSRAQREPFSPEDWNALDRFVRALGQAEKIQVRDRPRRLDAGPLSLVPEPATPSVPGDALAAVAPAVEVLAGFAAAALVPEPDERASQAPVDDAASVEEHEVAPSSRRATRRGGLVQRLTRALLRRRD